MNVFSMILLPDRVSLCVVGAGNCVTSCDLLIFADQAAEPITSTNTSNE
jgi:hypothetical protein